MVNIQTGSMLPNMNKSVKQCRFTTMHSGGLISPVVLQGSNLYAQYDPRSNVMIILDTLAKELGILIIPFQATFHQAAGAKGVC